MRRIVILISIIVLIFSLVIGLIITSKNRRVKRFNLSKELEKYEVLNSRYEPLDSLVYDCDWDKLEVTKEFKSIDLPETLPVLNCKYSVKEYSKFNDYMIENAYDDTIPSIFSSKLSESYEESIDEFLVSNDLVSEYFFFDELPSIRFTDFDISEGSVPIYQKFNDYNIYVDNLRVWKYEEREEYFVGLYPSLLDENTYLKIDSIENDSYIEIPILNSSKLTDSLRNSLFKSGVIPTLDDDSYYFCRGDGLKFIQLNEAEVIYYPLSDKILFPYIKIQGKMIWENESFDFAVLIDAADISKIEKDIYVEINAVLDPKSYSYSISAPLIDSIRIEDDEYIVEGYLPVNGYLHEWQSRDGVSKLFGDIEEKWSDLAYETINVRINDSNIYSGVASPIVNINEQLRDNMSINNETGYFSTRFTVEDFWKVYNEDTEDWIYRPSDITSREVEFKTCITISNQDFIEAYETNSEEVEIEGDTVEICSDSTQKGLYFLPKPSSI